MKPTNTQTNVPVYASESSYQTPAPTTQEQNEGVVPLDTLPASWWNALWQATAKNNNASKAAVDDLREEVISVLTDAGITLSEASTTQLLTAIKTITQRYATALIPGAVVSSSDIKQVSVSPTDGTMTVNAMNDWVGTGTIEQRMTAQDDKIESAIEGQDSKIESAIEGQDSKIEQRMAAQDDKIESAIEGQDDAIEKALEKIDSEVTKYSRIFTGALVLVNSRVTATIDLPAGTTLQKGDTIQFTVGQDTNFPAGFATVTAGGVQFTWQPSGGNSVYVNSGAIVTGIVVTSGTGYLQLGYFGHSIIAPRVNGVAHAGSAIGGYAAGDHVHPTQIIAAYRAQQYAPTAPLRYQDDTTAPCSEDGVTWFGDIVLPLRTAPDAVYKSTYLIPFLHSRSSADAQIKTLNTAYSSGAMPSTKDPGTRVNLYLTGANTAAAPILRIGYGEWESNDIEIRLPGRIAITASTASRLHNYNELVFDGIYWILLNSTASNFGSVLRLQGPTIWDWVVAQHTGGMNYVIPATGVVTGGVVPRSVVCITDSIASGNFLAMYGVNLLATDDMEPAYMGYTYTSRSAIPADTYVYVYV